MNKLYLVGLMFLLLMGSVMAASPVKEQTALDKITGWLVNDNGEAVMAGNLTQDRLMVMNKSLVQERFMVQEHVRMNISEINKFQEDLPIGTKTAVKEQQKLFGLFNVDRSVQYEKTVFGAERVRSMFDFLYTD